VVTALKTGWWLCSCKKRRRQRLPNSARWQTAILCDAEEGRWEAYQITKLAEADAERIKLTSEAQKDALRQILAELEGKGTLAEQYIQVADCSGAAPE